MSLHHKATQHEKLYQPPNYLNYKNSMPKKTAVLSGHNGLRSEKRSLFHRLRHHAKLSFTLSMGALGLLALMPPAQGHASVPFKNIKKKNIGGEGNSDNIWKQIADDFTLSGYIDNPAVQQQIRWYQQHPKSLTDIANQAAPYLYYVHEQVKEKGLPGELVLLPIIESTYNPFAYSNVGAAGLWQLMPQTAARLGLKQNSGFDGRRDVMSSTQAALGYLNYLDNMFDNNWLLALAAYNAGPGTVLNADKINKGDHSGTRFWSLHLPQQTKQYVPRLLAIAAIIQDPKKYGIDLPSIPNKPYFAKVDVNTPIALTKVAKLSDTSVDEVRSLNPGLKQAQTTSNTPTHVLIPVEKVQTFKENMDAQGKTVKVQMPAPTEEANAASTTVDPNPTKTDATPNTEVSPSSSHNAVVTYTVGSGDTLSKVAAHNHVKLQDLMTWNHLSAKSTLHKGQVLKLGASDKSTATDTKAGNTATTPQASSTATAQPTTYSIKTGDTLGAIAKKYGVSVNALLKTNHLKNNHLKIGQVLSIPKKA